MVSKQLRPITRSQLLRTLTDDPALPALIERMDAPTLRKLIEHVGLEDSGQLIALAREDQLAAVLDETLWTSEPGAEEALSVPELLRWLDVWNDIGSPFAATKLYELGADFCATCFAQLLNVTENGPLDDFAAAYGELTVRARIEDEWDVLLTTLNGLWSDYPDFLLHVLNRLCFRHSILAVDDAAATLHADAIGDRNVRRQRQGFVVANDAGAFLQRLRAAPLESLVTARAYDPLTQRHFAAQSLAAAQNITPPPAQEVDPGDEPAADEVTDADLDAMQAALEKAEIVTHRNTRLLTGPSAREADATLRRALSLLQATAPLAFSERMGELAYLSNTLMIGARFRGLRFNEEIAANAAMATCNLGVEYLVRREGKGAVDDLLGREPGLVRAFGIGFHLLNRLPVTVAERLSTLFQTADIRGRFGAKRWVLDEVDGLLGNDDFVQSVREGRIDDAKDTILVLTIAMMSEACACLRVLVDGFPAFPTELDRTSRALLVSDSARFIASLDDLETIDRFLQSLPDYVRL